MKHHAALFTAAMARAVVAGIKTQTRRHLYVESKADTERFDQRYPPDIGALPVGRGWSLSKWASAKPGDRLLGRENVRAIELPDGLDVVRYEADEAVRPIGDTSEAADAWLALHHYRGKRGALVPSIHMPKWAARIDCLITDVWVERLQEISDADAQAEGAPCYVCGGPMNGLSEADCHCYHRKATASDFANLWSLIHGREDWEANPWVVVVEFEKGGA